MAVLRMEHVGVIVDDLGDAIGFFKEIGLEVEGTATVEGAEVDRIIALDGARSDIAILVTPDGHSKIELVEFHSPPYEGDAGPEPSHAPGIRHILFAVDDVDDLVARLQARGAELVGEVVNYGTSYRLCYIRGPAGIIVELAEKLGPA